MRAFTVPGYGNRYRRWVRDSVRYIDVQDLATGGEHIPELSEVYVDIALVSRSTEVSRSTGAAERHSIGELLDRRSPAVLALIGQPGSGKSTLLANAARRGARTSMLGLPRSRRIPVLLALREHAKSILASPEISLSDVVREAVGGEAGKEPSGWWERQLDRGRCLVMLDGLDEVARADDRAAVADWVSRRIAAHPGNHFVVTSRFHGLPSSLAEQADVYVVRPFSVDQVRLFLDRWYLAAESRATGGSGRTAQRAVRMRASESAARLTSALEEYPALHDLAVNPLLLTMIATAHRYRGALPASRADLYEEICHVLLARRGQSKDLPQLLPWPVKQSLLATLAWQMMREQVSGLPADRVLEILGPQLERFPSAVTGWAFLDDISRNGLLIESVSGGVGGGGEGGVGGGGGGEGGGGAGGGGGYAFAHLTFQEYLAARHVSANPDLVKVLADNVSDSWWHETILLYATTADASPVIRACLESGTIPALTLAFDCAEASTEIDPDLRQRLGQERGRAFEPDCSAAHRRLIAGVEAARLTRQTLTTAAGRRICARPVPADLYWLFLADAKAPQPDGPSDPSAERPAAGMWGTEARSFVEWLNSITVTATGIEVGLPRPDELSEESVASALDARLPAALTGVWTAPEPELWQRPGHPHPHELTGAALRQVVAADVRNTAIVPRILTAAIVSVTLSIIRDLDDIRALSGALAQDLAARADSGGEAVDLMHAHAHAIVLTYGHALDLTRTDPITRTRAADPELIQALDVAGARALADAIAGDLASALDAARTRAAELAEAIDDDLSVLSAFDFDLAPALGLARAHSGDLDRVDLLARGLDLGPPVPGLLGLPQRWIAEGPLAAALLQVLAQTSDPGARPSGDPYLKFALELADRAGIQEDTRLRAALGRPVTSALRDVAAAASPAGEGPHDWHRATALRQLTDACASVYDTHQAPATTEAGALRLVALALASGAAEPGTDAPGLLRTVAATVTVVENRAKGESETGESIILALV